MKNSIRWSAACVTAALALTPAVAASASPHEGPRDGAVFVQLNGGAGNSIEAFDRGADGSLTPVGTFSTGGRGGKQVGAPVDALASQGSLAESANHRVLIAVNAGSNTVASLAVGDDGLHLTSVVPSRGDFPSSVTVHGSLVYVLDAGGQGTVSGYRLDDRRLVPIPNAVRSLGLGNDPVPAFLQSPAQIGLSPDGKTLVVTTKAHNTIVTFPVAANGTLGDPVVTPSAGPVPFSFVFDARGRLEVQQAGDGRNASYAIRPDSSLELLGVSAPSGGNALCWSVRVGHFVYGANAASGTLTSWRLAHDGTSTVAQPVAASVGPGVIDLAAADHGHYVYALDAITGTIDGYATDGAGGLAARAHITGLPVIDATGGPEGIVAN